jgi:hypothetical protein
MAHWLKKNLPFIKKSEKGGSGTLEVTVSLLPEAQIL